MLRNRFLSKNVALSFLCFWFVGFLHWDNPLRNLNFWRERAVSPPWSHSVDTWLLRCEIKEQERAGDGRIHTGGRHRTFKFIVQSQVTYGKESRTWYLLLLTQTKSANDRFQNRLIFMSHPMWVIKREAQENYLPCYLKSKVIWYTQLPSYLKMLKLF